MFSDISYLSSNTLDFAQGVMNKGEGKLNIFIVRLINFISGFYFANLTDGREVTMFDLHADVPAPIYQLVALIVDAVLFIIIGNSETKWTVFFFLP